MPKTNTAELTLGRIHPNPDAQCHPGPGLRPPSYPNQARVQALHGRLAAHVQ